MYRSRYDFASDYVDEDDVRAPIVKAKARRYASYADGMDRPRRAAEPLDNKALWVMKHLPADTSLDYTAENFPHIVNRMAALWDDARRLSDYIDKLMIDDRGGRAGFPFEALDELADVREKRLAQLTGKRSY